MCVLTPEAMEGPFYFDPKLLRSDITEGKQGAPLSLTLQILEANDCAPVPDTRVDVWHTDALVLYSGYEQQATGSSEVETFLRGTQLTGGTERYASRRSILDGIRAERRIFTSRCLSMIVASSRDSSTSPIPSPIMSTLRPHPIAIGEPSAIHSMRMTLSS